VTTLANEITRVQLMLQDIDVSGGNITLITQSITEAAQKLARLNYFPQISWLQGITGQSIYTLPATNVNISHVLYNEKVLRYVTESSFDRHITGWEKLIGEPRYWTYDNITRNTVRIIPAPSRTGAVVVFDPDDPLANAGVNNLIVFASDDVSANLGAVVMPTLLDYDDFIVYYGVYLHAMKETTQQNQPVANAANLLAEMWLQLMEKRKASGPN